ncbi:MAG: HNH endonuclease [Anaerolineae bacterium CG2_30_64_16]|nr:MAG: HNH endonuclease [Anaerolineae bacterium CG2_30_64_16]
MSKTHIPVDVRRRVAAAARYRCGYCLTSQRVVGLPMHLEHIIPEAAGDGSTEENLWLACPLCNGYKGVQTHAVDPLTGVRMPLFNPRIQDWHEHFSWSADGTEIIGKTPVGRATVLALHLNNPYVVPSRKIWVVAGWHPPKD